MDKISLLDAIAKIESISPEELDRAELELKDQIRRAAAPFQERIQQIRRLRNAQKVLANHDGPTTRGPTLQQRLADYLKVHQPARVARIARETGIKDASVSSILCQHPELFRRTEHGWLLQRTNGDTEHA